jgi:hypothetical protein
VGDAQADVVERADVAEGDRPDLSMRSWRTRWCARGLRDLRPRVDARAEGMQWRVAVQCTMGTVLVVGGAEGVELGLKDRQRRGRPRA